MKDLYDALLLASTSINTCRVMCDTLIIQHHQHPARYAALSLTRLYLVAAAEAVRSSMDLIGRL